MNKKYLKENNLYEAHKQFMKLCEFTYVPSSLEEEDDQMDNQMMGGEQGQDPMMGGNEQQDMGMPPMDNQMMGGEQGQDPMMGGNEQQDMGTPPMDDAMMGGDMNGEMPPMDDAMMDGEEEEVIDVEELTDAQEKMNDKVNLVGRNLEGFDSKIEALMQSIQKMESMIDANNQEIAAFKQEFEKRNPTQTEKLNLRSLDSYPFNVNPKDYWNGKGIDPNGNYSAIANNSIPTSQEYEITNSDVDNFDDKVIENSFDIDDDMMQDIKKIFNL
jgi:hypothetical protein